MATGIRIVKKDALIVVDAQNDFCPGGNLPVPDGDMVIPVANRLIRKFPLSVLTQDWHSKRHGSFASAHPGKKAFETVEMPYGAQVLWPDHCVAGSDGAAFHRDLATDGAALIIRKGSDPGIDSYSAFYENDRKTSTGLGGYLRERGIERAFLLGLATDFCVQYSALDAVKLGFDTYVVEDGCRGINLEGSLEDAIGRMDGAGIKLIKEADIE